MLFTNGHQASMKSSSRTIALAILACILQELMIIQGGIVDVVLNITHGFRALDGVERLVVMVNNQIPGPAIYCQKGDRVRILVNNYMINEETFTLHVHGMWQKGTPYMDGTTGTQCPIMCGGSFLYDFSVGDQVGTYWYHGHVDTMSRSDGVFGAFIVEDPDSPLVYDEERLLILHDWYHADGRALAAGLVQRPFKWTGDPQSILHNGKGNYSCAGVWSHKCTPQSHSQALEQIVVDAGKTYLFRIISVTSLSFLDFAIEDHNMTIVEADGTYLVPYQSTHLPINSGERYAVLIKANQPAGSSHWMASETRFRTLVKGYAVLQYAPASATFNNPTSSSSPPLLKAPRPHAGRWSADIAYLEDTYLTMSKNGTPSPIWQPYRDQTFQLQAAESLKFAGKLASSPQVIQNYPLVDATRHLFFTQTQCKTSADTLINYTPFDQRTQRYKDPSTTEGHLKWCLNNRSFRMPSSPIIIDIYRKTLMEENQDPLIVTLEYGQVVDVLLQNARGLNNVSEQHPWHIHGHSFWILGYGAGLYDPAQHVKTLNLINPVYRDMVTVFPFSWTLIRFKADNPGVWPLHCHIESHALMGMHIYFIEAPDRIGPPPQGYPICGAAARYDTSGKGWFPPLPKVTASGERRHPSALTIGLLGLFLTISLIINLVLVARKLDVGAGLDAALRRILAIRLIGWGSSNSSSNSDSRRAGNQGRGGKGQLKVAGESPGGLGGKDADTSIELEMTETDGGK